jgi:hypothetical protein
MASGMTLPMTSRHAIDEPLEPRRAVICIALGIALLFVGATRWPVARSQPFESDEFGFLAQMASHWFPMHHTLFMMLGRALAIVCGDPYRALIMLDMFTSAGAIVSVWWMLRAIVRPAIAAAAAILLGAGPVFWGYGAMAGNYTAIVLVGSFLLGVAYRGQSFPQSWQPFAAAAVLAIGTGYRPDIGTYWLPVFGVILWQHRWSRAIAAGVLFTVVNLAWLSAMLYDVGGWAQYRAASAEFAHQAGYLNSVWNLGFVDGPVRYAVKLAMALAWTLGPALLLVPVGIWRLTRRGLVKGRADSTDKLEPPALGIPREKRILSPPCKGGAPRATNYWISGNALAYPRLLCFLLAISIAPALASHLLVHFGVAGYSFHYVPALMVLVALGAGRAPSAESERRSLAMPSIGSLRESAPVQLMAIATVLAAMFWFYPTDYRQPGLRGSFDLSFCRFTRVGLKMPMPDRSPEYWRTANSRPLAGTPIRRPVESLAGEG